MPTRLLKKEKPSDVVSDLACKAEVAELHRAGAGEEDVGRLEVAMHDAAFVDVAQRLPR